MKLPGYYTSGQFAKLAHTTVRTIRYYDNQNILKPSYVNEAGARFYTDEDLARLQQILLLKYLGFSLEDIKNMTIGDSDYQILRNSLNLQLKLVKDRIEQMQLVANAIEDTTAAIDSQQEVDWSQMLNLIHLTNMENTLKAQYQNATNISARIHLHKLYSTNKQGWFPWIYEQSNITSNSRILELGCGSGSLWKENFSLIPRDVEIVLNDISKGMLRDTQREIEALEGEQHTATRFQFKDFDCTTIPYEDEYFDLIIANHVLFYLEDLPAALSEIRRVLRPDGHFICSTYGAAHMQEITELVQGFNRAITLSADKLYERFGLENGADILAPYFRNISMEIFHDGLEVDQPEPLIEYILSCHGNQNQYILDRYKDFRSYVEKKTKHGFHITKHAGIFLCKK